MRELTPDLWEISEGLYAERRGTAWFTSNEASEILTGPFVSLEALEADHLGTAAPEPADDGDLVTLRQAAAQLPVTHQALYYARQRGSLPAPVRVVPTRLTASGVMELYSLAALREIYARPVSERISEGTKRAWARRREANGR